MQSDILPAGTPIQIVRATTRSVLTTRRAMRATVTSTPYDNDRGARDDSNAAGKKMGPSCSEDLRVRAENDAEHAALKYGSV